MGSSVGDENVAGLVKELTSQLATIAERFSTRAETLMAGERPTLAESRSSPVALARLLLAQRAKRLEHFPNELFHEPAWDMLLALYIANAEQRVMNVKTLVASANAPVTTSQRWIDHLHKLKLIDRVIDPADRRRIEVSLSEDGERSMDAYLNATAAAIA